jgi:hypothetical protein
MLPEGYVDLVAVFHHLPASQLGATALHSNQLWHARPQYSLYLSGARMSA